MSDKAFPANSALLAAIASLAQAFIRKGKMVTISLAARIAPGVFAIYLSPTGHYAVIFNRRHRMPPNEVIEKWGRDVVLPEMWKDMGWGYLPCDFPPALVPDFAEFREKYVKFQLLSTDETEIDWTGPCLPIDLSEVGASVSEVPIVTSIEPF